MILDFKSSRCSLKGASFLLLLGPPRSRKALAMAEIRPSKPKRPTCATCSKPSRLCLCTRIKTQTKLDNSIAVTLLQHTLEKKHPLNSARIAMLGLKNATLSTVSDVNFEAQFDIRLLEPAPGSGSVCNDNAHRVFVKCPNVKSTGLVCESEKLDSVNDHSEISFESSREIEASSNEIKVINGEIVITAKIEKQGSVSQISHIWTDQNRPEKPEFDTLLEIKPAREALSRGFTVRKLQKRQKEEVTYVELEEFVEFEINVPHGSILLFPSQDSIGLEELRAMDFVVKNLIVLDGTWAKAKRMYSENPWLKLIPHLKLDLDRVSLYDGVRMQPKVGCLSTIESIVYSLQALGCGESLEELLVVFESMVDDQRECKEKRMRIMASESQ